MTRRPTEDYALARVTMLEQLDRLSPRQRQTAVLHAAGYSLVAIAEMQGYKSKQAAQYLFGRALDGIRDKYGGIDL